jgi:hypothetical protein
MGQSLTVDVGARTVSFEEGMRRAADVANQQMKSIGGSIDRLQNQISSISDKFAKFTGVLAGLGAGVSFTSMISSAIDAADKLEKLSQKTGITVEQLSGLAYSAKLTSTDIDGVAASTNKLAKNMVSAASGTGSQAAAFAAVGVSVKDASGKLRDSNAVLGDLAEKFKSYADGPAKAALAQELFGKSGAAMIPLLNQGREALEKQRAEAERYSGVTTEVAQRAAAFSSELSKVKMIASGVGTSIMATLLPAMEGISNVFVWLREHSNGIGAALIAAGTAALIFAAGSSTAAGAVTVLTGAFMNLTVAMLANPFGLIATAIAGAMAALYYFRDTTFQIGETTTTISEIIVGAWEYVKKAFSAVFAWIRNDLAAGEGQFASFVNFVKQLFVALWEAAKAHTNFIVRLFVSVGKTVGVVAAAIVDHFKNAFDRMKNLAVSLWDGVKKVFSGDFSFSAFTEEVAKGGARIADVGAQVKDAWVDAFNTDYVGEFVDGAKTALGGVVESLAAVGKEAKKFNDELNGDKPDAPMTGGSGFAAFAENIDKRLAYVIAGYEKEFQAFKDIEERKQMMLKHQREMNAISEAAYLVAHYESQISVASENAEKLKKINDAFQSTLAEVSAPNFNKGTAEYVKQNEKIAALKEKIEKNTQEIGKAEKKVTDLVLQQSNAMELLHKAQQDFIDKIKRGSEDYSRSLKERVKDMQFETSLIGKSAVEASKLRAARALTLDLEKKLLEYDEQINVLKKFEKENEEAILEILRAKEAAIKDTAEAIKEIQKEIEKQDWSKSFDSITQSLSDALYRGFENGKSMAENFKDALINTFKTMILKPVIEFVVKNGMNMFSGGGSGFLSNLGGIFGGMFGGVNQQPNSGIYGPTPDGGNISKVPASGASFGGMFSSWLGYAAMIYAMMQENDKLFKQGWQPQGQYNDIQKELLKHFGISNLLGTGPVLGGVFMNGAIQMGLDKLLQGLGLSGRTASLLTGSALWTRAFGYKKPEMTSGGVQGTLSLGGFEGEMFQDWTAKGGWFRRDKHGTETEAMNREMRQLVNSTIGQVPKQMKELLEGFGQDFNTVFGEDWSKYFKIVLSDKGDWEDVRARLANETARVYRDMATVAVESIREGWGQYVDDLKDLEADGFYAEMSRIILSLNILDDIKGAQDKIFGVTGLIVDDFEALADSGELIYETISRLAETFEATKRLSKITGIQFAGVGLESAETRQAFVDDAGGIEALSELTGTYWNLFATEQEKFNAATDSLRDIFDGIGVEIPNTVDAFRELIAAQDMSTEAGRKLALQLMQVAPAFNDVIGAIDALSKSMDAKIGDLRRTLEMGGLDQQETYNYLKREGDDAFKSLQEATGIEDINKYFEQAMASLSQTFAMLDDEGKKAKKHDFLAQLDELEAVKNERLQAVKDSFINPSEAIEEAGKAVAQALANVAEQLGIEIDIKPFFESAARKVDLDAEATDAMTTAAMILRDAAPALELVNRIGIESQEAAGESLSVGAAEVRSALGTAIEMVSGLGAALGNIKIQVEVVNREPQVGHAY